MRKKGAETGEKCGKGRNLETFPMFSQTREPFLQRIDGLDKICKITVDRAGENVLRFGQIRKTYETGRI